jgi:hypothetical protein
LFGTSLTVDMYQQAYILLEDYLVPV